MCDDRFIRPAERRTGAVGWGKVVGKKVKVHHRFTLQLSPVRFITYFVIIFM